MRISWNITFYWIDSTHLRLHSKSTQAYITKDSLFLSVTIHQSHNLTSGALLPIIANLEQLHPRWLQYMVQMIKPGSLLLVVSLKPALFILQAYILLFQSIVGLLEPFIASVLRYAWLPQSTEESQDPGCLEGNLWIILFQFRQHFEYGLKGLGGFRPFLVGLRLAKWLNISECIIQREISDTVLTGGGLSVPKSQSEFSHWVGIILLPVFSSISRSWGVAVTSILEGNTVNEDEQGNYVLPSCQSILLFIFTKSTGLTGECLVLQRRNPEGTDEAAVDDE